LQNIKYIPQYDYSDYEKWEGDWELIDGYPFSMSPSASGRHQFVSAQLLHRIMKCLEGKECTNECYVYAELDWIIDNINVVRPDLAVVCGNKVEKFIEIPPVLIVEILSESSVYRDRIVKKELYEFHGIKYYLIADPETKTVEVFELIDGKYQPLLLSTFTLSANCKLVLDFTSIW